MKTSLLFLLFCIASIKSNTFNMKNERFEANGISDIHNKYIYVEIKIPDVKKIKICPAPTRKGNQENGIESLKKMLENITLEVELEEYQKYLEPKRNKASFALWSTISLIAMYYTITNPVPAPGGGGIPTIKGLELLIAANTINDLAYVIVDNQSPLSKPLLSAELIMSFVKIAFIEKSIAINAISPWAAGIYFGISIARSLISIFDRILSTPKPTETTVKITENKNKYVVKSAPQLLIKNPTIENKDIVKWALYFNFVNKKEKKL